MSARTAALDFDLIARLRAASRYVGTLLNVRFTAAVRAHLDADAEVNHPRRYLAPAYAAITDAVAAMVTAIDG
jgi:fructose/tagatose bisphosphate aldolase